MRNLITVLCSFAVLTQAFAAAEAPKPAAAPGTAKAESAKEASKVETKTETKAAVPAQKEAGAKAVAAEKEAPAQVNKDAGAKAIATERDIAALINDRLVAQQKARANGPGYNKAAISKPTVRKAKPAAAMSEAVKHDVHWSYTGEGAPINWGKLNPAWVECSAGARQSPINIRDGIKLDLDPVAFDYKPSRFNVVDNGHTIQVNPGPRNFITVVGKKYELVQFHFHRPSEERIDGRGSEMVVHLVHKDMDGKLAVVAVMIDAGQPNDVVQTVWNNLPLEKNEPVAATTLLNVNQLLPRRHEYYTYMGSLTTPPCSEGVLWIVLKEPIQLSEQQINVFARFYPMNARPVQANGGRVIKESN